MRTSTYNQEEVSQYIEEARSQIEKTAQMNEQVMKSISNGEMLDKLGDNDIDIQTAVLSDIKRQEEAMAGNVSVLIVNLDNITKGFGDQFEEMQVKTFSEKLVGFFSDSKSEEMQEDRIKASSIEDQLQNLIVKSETLTKILKTQLEVLETQKVKVTKALENAMEERKRVSVISKDLETKRDALEQPILDLIEKIQETTEEVERTALEKEYQTLVNEQNDIIADIQVNMTESQSHEKYVKMHQTILDSISNQISTQKALIQKLIVDTQNRVIAYEATAKSLKTAKIQQTAHKVNDIGGEVDTALTKTAAIIGSASQNDLMKMLEAHPGYMAAQEEIQRQKALADESFYRRFDKAREQQESGNY